MATEGAGQRGRAVTQQSVQGLLPDVGVRLQRMGSQQFQLEQGVAVEGALAKEPEDQPGGRDQQPGAQVDPELSQPGHETLRWRQGGS